MQLLLNPQPLMLNFFRKVKNGCVEQRDNNFHCDREEDNIPKSFGGHETHEPTFFREKWKHEQSRRGEKNRVAGLRDYRVKIISQPKKFSVRGFFEKIVKPNIESLEN